MPALTLDATTARIHSVGNRVAGGWNLFSNGELGDYVLFPTAGKYRVQVRAWGSVCQRVWPEMALVVDGEQVQKTSVTSPQPKDYTFELSIPAGAHSITLGFLNDAVAQIEDRNLYIGQVKILAMGGVAEPTLATPEQVVAESHRLEAQILAESDAAIERYRKGNALLKVLDSQGKPVVGAKVSIKQHRHDFLFGCNIYGFDQFKTAAQNEEYQRRFADLFNYATVGFYWRWYEPQPGQPRYEPTDKVVAWCLERGIRMKGHPLLWADEAGIPVWSKGQPASEQQRERVRAIMNRYQGKITYWEVVNEPSHLPSLKIDAPYRWAREVDSKAILIVNDYYVLADGHPPFYRLLEQALQNGVPFDGIGIQAHEPRTMRFPLARVKRILDRYATLGKPLHITEFTPTSAGQPMTGTLENRVWNEAAQAEYAVQFYRVCFAHPALVAITWWDLCDAHSWLKGGGMLRQDLSPKPVYAALHKLIHEQWQTQVETNTDAQGQCSVRGFFGQYEVRINQANGETVSRFALSQGSRNEWIIRLPSC